MGKYEEALERARQGLPMDKVFPELSMSEDERTRKELIHFILYKAGQLLDEETEHKFVAYLGKQKEQKPAEKSEKPIISEWNEEDGLARDFLLTHIEQYIKVLESLKTETYLGSNGLSYVATDIANWQSARSFILSSCPHWKPSEE